MAQENNELEPPPDSGQVVCERLKQSGADLKEINRVKRKYPMKITPYYLGLVRQKGDPVWKQCVPGKEELEDFLNADDPLKEEEHTPVPYLVHKYPDRVLLLVSSKCAMYCRFCTRKRKVGRIRQTPMEDIFRAIQYIEEHKEVRDVIVSGGDPLMRSNSEIEAILSKIRMIPHVQIIRIGTRMPCVKPSRITPKLASMLKKYHPLYINIHFNHPAEITEQSKKACEILADAGIPLGSQTVLLKGVNDSPDVMKELIHKLLQIRVKPYYIYACDLVRGANHFRTSVEEGIEIMKQIQGFTSGLGLPHFVIDGPGGKVPVSPRYVKDVSPDHIILNNYLGNLYKYPELKNNKLKYKFKNDVTRIGIAFNLKKDAAKNERYDRYAEYDDIETIDAVRTAIENAGYEVMLLEANSDFPEKVKNSNADFVFNIAEGINGASRESYVPAVLDALNIPYSGSGVLTQAITLNKSRKKEILNYHGIPTPKFQVFGNSRKKPEQELKFPLIVKPEAEGSSIGVTNNSLVFDIHSLRKQAGYVIKNYSQNALVEEYCNGREFTLGLIGNNHNVRVLPIVEIDFSHLPPDLHKFESYESKWIYDSPKSPVDPLICPAKINPGLKARLEKIAGNTFSALGCSDFCRIDIRLDSRGIPNVLDVNALPGLMPDPKSNSRFTRACYAYGMTYSEMIIEILNAALKRYNLSGVGKK